MPSYKVIKKGFYNGKLYDPRGKRSTIHVELPFKPVPTWLEPIKAETPAERKKRLADEKEALAAAKKAKVDDQKQIDELTFIQNAETKVETL